MSTPSVSSGSALLTLIESDLLTSAGTPLLTLIEALNAANSNPFAITAAWGQFVGNLQPALLQFEKVLSGQILSAIQAKLTGALASAQTNITATNLAAGLSTK